MDSELNVIICGINGRMGQAVRHELDNCHEFAFLGGVDAADSQACFEQMLKNASVVIDFSVKDASVQYAEACSKAGVPFLSGVTGLSGKQHEALKKISESIPVFWSPNMSPAVNLLSVISGYIAKKLPGFDVHIHEIHHKAKKDSPSGTALGIASSIERLSGRRPGISSARLGGITGIHEVVFGGPYETLEITHRAGARALFASGALTAAKWLVSKKAGYYTYADILDIKELGF